MDFKKLVSEAGVKLNRAVQKTNETLLSAEKTEYDLEYKNMLTKIDTLNFWTDKFVKEATAALEPNLAFRLEDKVLDKIDRKNERITPLEVLGGVYEKAGEAFAPLSGDLSKCFATFGGIEVRVGITSKEFQKRAVEVYVSKLKIMNTIDLKKFQEERTSLENLRLDLDSYRSKLRRASENNRRSAEDAVQNAEIKFNQQLSMNKEHFAHIDELFKEHQTLIKAFVSTQISYYAECQRELERLEKQL